MHTPRLTQKKSLPLRKFGGFTLVETLVAIVVITFAVIGPYQIVQGVLQTAFKSRDQIMASALAQEGMEYVREVRDSNYLYNARGGGVNWLNGLDGTNGPNCYTSACVVDSHYYPPTARFVAGSSITSCGNSTCASQPLYLNSSSYRYNQQNVGTKTKFVRKVQLTQISTTETLVTVTVTWDNHGIQTVKLEEYLQNWL